jgi:hypothetical protein
MESIDKSEIEELKPLTEVKRVLSKNKQLKVGFPAYVPDDPERLFEEPTKKEQQRRQKIKEYIKKTLEADPCTNEISGATLFNELF